ncbi:MAG TPA: CHASE domain-containing protein [Thermoanaerobaculia bacterium]|jgi:signal transduction histidine kinase/CheY-like chemotaxis protein|nr:CHASE domain-containing protein [Thermoanaerobaculia bacterium]
MSRSPDRFAPWLVLAVFLGLTGVATMYVSRMADLAVRNRFDSAAQTTRDAIEGRIDTYVNVLTAANGLFAAESSVTQDEFRNYVRNLDVQRRYPGMQGMGLMVRFPQDRLQEVISTMRGEGYSDFRVWPKEPPRPEYTAVIVLEPQDPRNLAALGYDMSADPSRRTAMFRARDDGQPAATGRVELLPDGGGERHVGFLIFIPIYLPAKPETPAQRRDALYGWVYAPFRAQELFSGPLAAQHQMFDLVEVYDGPRLLFRQGADGDAHFTRRLQITVADRKWTVVFRRAGAGAFSSLLSMATLAGGLVITMLFFTLVRLQTRGRFAAEATAERLRRSEGELQRANQAKDEFLATLSHELRTPMTAIIGWARLLGEGDLDPETTGTAIDAIQKSSRAQAQLIDDLLDVSRITAGKMHIDPRPIELAPVVAAALDSIAPAAETKGVRLERELPPRPLVVSGDAHRLQQVLWNLMTNAVKFTPRGGSVRVSLRGDNGDAVIEVTDTGRGIDPEFLPHVFERFRQADSSMTRAYTGLGLGLAIVRHLVEMHGGSVSASSEGEGKGATFVVRLPLLSAMPRPQESGPASYENDVLRNARLLIVDDEESVRNYAAAVFRISGADARIVESAREALALLDRWRPDVVITDLGMPDMDGYELLRQLRGRGLTVPVIALTAYARPEDRETAMRAGFTAYVAKPVEPEELRRLVADVLATSRR